MYDPNLSHFGAPKEFRRCCYRKSQRSGQAEPDKSAGGPPIFLAGSGPGPGSGPDGEQTRNPELESARDDAHLRVADSDERSRRKWSTTSLRWKLRWQLQAAHWRAAAVPSSPAGMNSRQPSTAWPPMLAAWFFLHSAYLTTLFLAAGPLGYFPASPYSATRRPHRRGGGARDSTAVGKLSRLVRKPTGCR
ncbi:unnamed protein product [Spirodela intermedia]|uniref:Uncharacterized protein n=1 Tax=Spirodela intermedia TaxID=51605 RepID=A0A7I8JYR0_SPIIN|nr:unnamed protein product [Spirodela intermedia]